MTAITRLLLAASHGDPVAAADLFPVVYTELRRLAAAKLAREAVGHSLEPTMLVHEAFLRLVGDQKFDGKGHFFAAAAEAMRRILVDQARARRAVKRGGATKREPVGSAQVTAASPDDELLALDECLGKLAEKYPDHAELVKLRYFAGLTADEAAAALGISASTGDRRWTFARAWLKRAMD